MQDFSKIGMSALGGGILGSVLGSLFGGPKDYLRDEDFAPRRLLVRAGNRALDREREMISTQFGFRETIAEDVMKAKDSARIGLLTDPSIRRDRVGKEVGGRKTLL
jgi:hypothetical protein